MKKVLFLLCSILFLGSAVMAQKPAASPSVTTESANVKVTYGQPSKKDRVVFGKLVPYGQVWRTGANEGTEVTFKKDVNFGGTNVKAGTYTLFTIPGEKEWSVILNSTVKQWGAYGYDKIKASNVAEVKVMPMQGEAAIEKLTITAQDTDISLAWDKTIVKVGLTW